MKISTFFFIMACLVTMAKAKLLFMSKTQETEFKMKGKVIRDSL